MILPSTHKNKTEWTFVGPLGPNLPETLAHHPTIAVDGGGAFVTKPDIWVGDADSLVGEIECPHKFKHPTQKSQSDLGLALELFPEYLLYKFHFWGFLGGRRDHELFNLGEAHKFLEEHPESHIIFYDENGREIFHFLGAGFWKFQHQGLFSLGTLKTTAVKLTGDCEYPIPRFRNLLPLSSFGLSNVAKGEIRIEADGAFFIYYPEGK